MPLCTRYHPHAQKPRLFWWRGDFCRKGNDHAVSYAVSACGCGLGGARVAGCWCCWWAGWRLDASSGTSLVLVSRSSKRGWYFRLPGLLVSWKCKARLFHSRKSAAHTRNKEAGCRKETMFFKSTIIMKMKVCDTEAQGTMWMNRTEVKTQRENVKHLKTGAVCLLTDAAGFHWHNVQCYTYGWGEDRAGGARVCALASEGAVLLCLPVAIR